MRGARAAALLALGCSAGKGGPGGAAAGGADTAGAADAGAGGGSDTGPSAHSHAPDAAPTLPEVAALERALTAGLTALAALEPGLVFGAQDAALDNASAACPGLFAAVGLTTGWSADCTTPSGWGFDGRGQAAWLADRTVDGELLERYGTFITTTTFTHPGGATLTIDGRGDYAMARSDGALTLSAGLSGTFGAAPGGSPWLDLAPLEGAPSVSVSWEGGAADDARWLTLEGGLSGGPAADDAGLGLRAEGLTLREEGGACTASGAVVILLRSGARVDLPLDAAPCAGCAPAYDPSGAEVGSVCFDLAPLWQPGEWRW